MRGWICERHVEHDDVFGLEADGEAGALGVLEHARAGSLRR